MAKPTIAAGCLAAMLFAAGNSALDAPVESARIEAAEQAPADAESDKVRRLLEERLAAAMQLVEHARTRRELSAGTPEEVAAAERFALRAELDLADTRERRIAVLERLLSIAEQSEELAVARHRMGQVPPDALLKAKIARIEAEIELERAMSESAP